MAQPPRRKYPSRNKFTPWLTVMMRRTESLNDPNSTSLTSTVSVTAGIFSCQLSTLMDTVPDAPPDQLYAVNKKLVVGSDIGIWDSGTLVNLAIVVVNDYSVNPFLRKSIDNGETWTDWSWILSQSATASSSRSITSTYTMLTAKNGVLALGQANADTAGKLIGILYSTGNPWRHRKLVSTDGGVNFSYRESSNWSTETTGTLSMTSGQTPVSGSGCWLNYDDEVLGGVSLTTKATLVFGHQQTTLITSGINGLYSGVSIGYKDNGNIYNKPTTVVGMESWLVDGTLGGAIATGSPPRFAARPNRAIHDFAVAWQAPDGEARLELVEDYYNRVSLGVTPDTDFSNLSGTDSYTVNVTWTRQSYTLTFIGEDSSLTRSTACFAKPFFQSNEARMIFMGDSTTYGPHLKMAGIRSSINDSDKQDRFDAHLGSVEDDIGSISYSLLIIATNMYKFTTASNSRVEAAYDPILDRFYVAHFHSATAGVKAMKVIRSTDGACRDWEVMVKNDITCMPDRMNNSVARNNVFHIACFGGPVETLTYSSSQILKLMCSGSAISSYSSIVIRES